ncbi:hypothetical protein NA57DRAFT_50816 [Rhizodiscina lignyota]|uniref:Uncharacterized protein n=1 Tax=Rhizodiscina lignyota TaxID=1504668 RepID=A0A9P4MAR7_9PEZI|nr:hypothetical protein NA57DRAFT_50816 [Rhizodiscina lignyota]
MLTLMINNFYKLSRAAASPANGATFAGHASRRRGKKVGRADRKDAAVGKGNIYSYSHSKKLDSRHISGILSRELPVLVALDEVDEPFLLKQCTTILAHDFQQDVPQFLTMILRVVSWIYQMDGAGEARAFPRHSRCLLETSRCLVFQSGNKTLVDRLEDFQVELRSCKIRFNYCIWFVVRSVVHVQDHPMDRVGITWSIAQP